MLVPEHIEQLIQTVQQHLEQQRKPISEHELLVKLAKQGVWNNVTKGSAILQQFQKHFLTMHALYRLQTRLGDSNCRLHISPVSIYLQRPDEEMEDLDPDQELEICEASDTHLREYYLDLNHLVAANDASVADLVAAKGTDAVSELSGRLDELKVAKQENIELGEVKRFEPGEGALVDTYLHVQDGRGVNAVLVELKGGDSDLAHQIAVHLAFTKAPYLTRDEVPAEEVETEKANLESLTRAEGKPEQALPKIVEGRLGAWFKERVLLEQNYVKDDKQTISDLLGDAEIVRFAQVYIGA